MYRVKKRGMKIVGKQYSPGDVIPREEVAKIPLKNLRAAVNVGRIEEVHEEEPAEELPDKESLVLLIEQGLTNKEIAGKYNVNWQQIAALKRKYEIE